MRRADEEDPVAEDELTEEGLSAARVIVPEHVVFRSFEAETVLLNLSSGQYHGLNATGGRMLELLRENGSVSATAAMVAEEFKQPVDEVTSDLVQLCQELAARGLIEVGAEPVD
jgi:hypothetical protein